MMKRVIYKEVKEPSYDIVEKVFLKDETMLYRKDKVIKKIKEANLDKLIIYCDVEHAGNFMYLVGFYTRFEEALLIIDKSGEITLLLGNENLNKYTKSRCKAKAIHVSLFSLPNQPNRNDKTLKELLIEAGIEANDKIGLVGWKLFTSSVEKEEMFDLPHFIVHTLSTIVNTKLKNATSLFIGEEGVRCTNNANEIAHYEYGSALSSNCILDAMNKIKIGISEYEIGDCLNRYGQHNSVTLIASSGERFVKGNMFPTNKKVQLQDTISITTGFAGGSSSRAGYAVNDESQLPEKAANYMDEMVKPYCYTYAKWLEQIRVGMKGKDMYNFVESIFPKKEYGWNLCPGHLVAEEEWLSSPIYDNSEEILMSGMIFQIDIIPSRPGMGGISGESTIVIADQELQKQIQKDYPQMWNRMMERRRYLKEELHINVHDDVLPMCNSVAYIRPFLLNKKKAMCLK